MEHDNESNPGKRSPSSCSPSPSPPSPPIHSSHLHSFSISRLDQSHLRRSPPSPSSMPISLTTNNNHNSTSPGGGPSVHHFNNINHSSSLSPNHSNNSLVVNGSHNLSIHHHHSSQLQQLQQNVNHHHSHHNNNTSSASDNNSRSPPSSLTPQSFSSPNARRLSSGLSCVVCGDTSSGKHYGILACNGCSGFFKRSVRRKLIYRCQAGTGSCIVDKAHRNQCQACRLKKCLNMGMNKDAVQNERQPRNTATLRPEAFCEMDQERALREAAVAVGVFGPLLGPRGHGALTVVGGPHHLTGGSYIPASQPPPMILSSAQSNESLNGIRDDDEDSIDVTSDDNIPSSNNAPLNLNNNSNNNSNNNVNNHSNNASNTKSSVPNGNNNGGGNNNNISSGINRSQNGDANHRNNNENAHSNRNNSTSSANTNNNNSNNNSNGNNNNNNNGIPPQPHPASINFSVPTAIAAAAIYNHQETIYETSARLLFMAVKWAKNLPSFGSLPFRDQVILLEEAWSDLFLLNAIQWCMPGDSASLFSTTDHIAHLPNGKAVQVAGDLRNLNDALLRFRAIGVDPAEFACLKAIALFKSDTRGLKDPLQVENLQDQAQVMLCQHSRGQHPTHPARFGRLLLMLPLLRLVTPQRIEFLFFQRTIGNTPMEKVLCDMYKN